MLCKNRITLIGFLGQHAETRYTSDGTAHTRFSIATSVSWRVKETGEYNTRTQWHRVISWNKLGQWAASLQKGAYVEVEGELRYREFTPAESDRSVRVAESMPVRFCYWTAPTGSRLPKLPTQSLSKNQLIKPIRRASAASMPGFFNLPC